MGDLEMRFVMVVMIIVVFVILVRLVIHHNKRWYRGDSLHHRWSYRMCYYYFFSPTSSAGLRAKPLGGQKAIHGFLRSCTKRTERP